MPPPNAIGAIPRTMSMRDLLVRPEWNFVPVTEGGKPVVRKVTDEDLDELGPAVLDFCTQ